MNRFKIFFRDGSYLIINATTFHVGTNSVTFQDEGYDEFISFDKASVKKIREANFLDNILRFFI